MTEQSEHQPRVVETDEEDNSSLDSSGGTTGVSRLWRRTAGAAAVVAVLVIGNATVNTSEASASTRAGATAASAPAASPAPVGTPAPNGDGELSGAPLHGEFKVINRDGSAQLRRWQSGAVDAIDEISMTVHSADGFDSTYLLGPGVSVTGIGLGDEVTVVGAGQAVPTGNQRIA